MKRSNLVFSVLSILFFIGCGSSAGVDPHLSLEEQQEITDVNLVGKWKIRRTSIGSISGKTAVSTANCSIDAIEFFDDRSYVLEVSTAETAGDTISKIYRGKYDLDFVVNNNEPSLNKIVLMDADYLSGTNFPAIGSVATIDEINLSSEEVSFRIELGQSTVDFCIPGAAISLEGDKEEKLEPEATEDSNHVKIQQEWRLIDLIAAVQGSSQVDETSQDICLFLEGDYYDRCYNEETDEFLEDCPQAVSSTLLMSGYGTFLFTYFDANGSAISSDNGEWRWRTDTTLPYSSFMVKGADEDSFEEGNTTIDVISITDTTMTLEELYVDTNEAGESMNVTLRYSFQLASLPYQDVSCDFDL